MSWVPVAPGDEGGCFRCNFCESRTRHADMDRSHYRIRHRKVNRRIGGWHSYASIAHSLFTVLIIASLWCTVEARYSNLECTVLYQRRHVKPDLDQSEAFTTPTDVHSSDDCTGQCCQDQSCDMAFFSSGVCRLVDCSYSSTVCQLQDGSEEDVIIVLDRSNNPDSLADASLHPVPVLSRHKGLSPSSQPPHNPPGSSLHDSSSYLSYSSYLDSTLGDGDDELVDGYPSPPLSCLNDSDCGVDEWCPFGSCSCKEGFSYNIAAKLCMLQAYTESIDDPQNTEDAAKRLENIEPTDNPSAPQGPTLALQQASPKPQITNTATTTTIAPGDATTLQPTQRNSTQNLTTPSVHETPAPEAKPLPITTPRFVELTVFGGDDRVLTLPDDHVTLHALVEPEEPPNGGQYRYEWRLMEGPPGSEKNKDGNSLELTNLQAGVYLFEILVTAPSASGTGYVNVTVNPPPRVNAPPEAVVVPSDNITMFENEEQTLDATKSTDDFTTDLSYLWEVVSSPVEENLGQPATGPVYRLQDLNPGFYQFKLTVTDEDKASDTRIINVTVMDEVDLPPTANAGTALVKHLPLDSIVLNGNASRDDHGIVQWKWTRLDDDGGTADLSGSNEPALTVSLLQEGIYNFQLTVYDRKGQSDSDPVSVHILSEELNQPPVAKAGPQKELSLPDESTSLDGQGSTDDSGITTYLWEKTDGPDSDDFAIIDGDKVKATVSGLVAGTYTFKLTVTDKQGDSDSDTTQVVVKEEVNLPPVSNAGNDITVVLPVNYVELDGSQSTDDKGISSYSWSRTEKSPAAGIFLADSQKSSQLKVFGLVQGVYTFNLTVTDAKGMASWDTTTVTVKQDPHLNDLVEMVFNKDISAFKESEKKDLVLFLQFLLPGDVVLQEVTHTTSGQLQVIFYATNSSDDKSLLKGTSVLEILKDHVSGHQDSSLLKMNLDSYDTVVCQRNCSNHGTCDQFTRKCVCETFWMPNIFRVNFGDGETNCDWSILYVIIIIFLLLMFLGVLIWMAICCCSRKKKKSRRKYQYSLLTEDLEGNESIGLSPMKANGNVLDKLTDHDSVQQGKQNSSIMVSASGEDTDDEITIYDHRKKRSRSEKKPLNGHVKRSKRYPGRVGKI